MAKQDSLNTLKNKLDDYAISLTKANHSLDSLKKMQYYNGIQFDLSEFSKSGICKIFAVNKADTFSVHSIFDFEHNKCKVSVCKGNESKGGTDVNLK